MNFKHAIFDLDGTLLDSMPVWDTLAARYLRLKGKEPKAGLRAALSVMDMTGSAQFLIREYGLSGSVQTVIDEMNALGYQAYAEEVQPKPCAAEFLKLLRDHGVTMCIATATDRPLVEAALRRLNLLTYFERIFTCTEVGIGKSRPDIYDAARTALGGTKADTLIFEDALHAIETAKAAGYRVAAVPDASALKDRERIHTLADCWLDGYEQAIERFNQSNRVPE